VYDGDFLTNPIEYRSVVGALQYLTITLPDLAFAVNQVGQFMHRPTTSYWMPFKRILRFAKSTYDHGLVYSLRNLQLQAFSDEDYASDLDERRSTGGYCIYLRPNLISWSSKKQGGGISHSSTEAGYRQLA
jgi:histone deacetylase 1/2